MPRTVSTSANPTDGGRPGSSAMLSSTDSAIPHPDSLELVERVDVQPTRRGRLGRGQEAPRQIAHAVGAVLKVALRYESTLGTDLGPPHRFDERRETLLRLGAGGRKHDPMPLEQVVHLRPALGHQRVPGDAGP